jgi:flagellar hook-associated protein 2
MAALSSPGIGSGLDINGIVSKLMQVESQPLTALKAKEASYQAKLSAFGILKGALSSLQKAAQTLATTSTFTGMSASVSDSSVFTATAANLAAAGSYDIAVTRLAKAHSLYTNVDYGSDTFDSGTLRIAIGAGGSVDIAVPAGLTLSGIRDAINDAQAGVTASIINDGSADRLLLTSQTTGTAGTIGFTAPATHNDGTRRLTDLVGANLSTAQPAQDAELSINGLAITRTSNTIDDAIPGVTLTLLKADASTPPVARLTVAANTSAVTSAINAFVKAYNDAVGSIKQLTAYDAANKKASVLTGDGTVRGIQLQLGNLVFASVSGLSGGIARLSDLGIAVQKDGTLTLDSGKLSAALADRAKDVATLFTQTTPGNEGIAVRFKNLLDGILEQSGPIASRTNGINATIKDLQQRADAWNQRLTRIEARYRTQFTALDSMLASMTQTSNFLQQQIANLTKSNK